MSHFIILNFKPVALCLYKLLYFVCITTMVVGNKNAQPKYMHLTISNLKLHSSTEFTLIVGFKRKVFSMHIPQIKRVFQLGT